MDGERTDSESRKTRGLGRTAWTLRVSALSVAVSIVLACGEFGLALLIMVFVALMGSRLAVAALRVLLDACVGRPVL